MQQRVQHQQVEQLVEVPIPQIEEEIVHVPKIITQKRVQHQQVEQVVEVPVPMMEEEIVHVPKIITQTRQQQQHVEQDGGDSCAHDRGGGHSRAQGADADQGAAPTG